MSIIIPNLRVKMAEKGWNIKDVHEKTSLSRTTISNMYNYYIDGIKFDTLSELCDLFNCEIQDILKKIDVELLSYTLDFHSKTTNKSDEDYDVIYNLKCEYIVDEEVITETFQARLNVSKERDIDISSGALELWYLDGALYSSKTRFNESIEKRIIKNLDAKILNAIKEDRKITKEVDMPLEILPYVFEEE